MNLCINYTGIDASSAAAAALVLFLLLSVHHLQQTHSLVALWKEPCEHEREREICGRCYFSCRGGSLGLAHVTASREPVRTAAPAPQNGTARWEGGHRSLVHVVETVRLLFMEQHLLRRVKNQQTNTFSRHAENNNDDHDLLLIFTETGFNR